MQTKVGTEKFRQVVNICNRFVSLKPTLPVLSNIKLVSTKTQLQLSSTNLENSIIVKLSSTGEDWETTIPAKLLVEFLNLLTDQETKITVNKEVVRIDSGEAHGEFNTIAASEFPDIKEEKEKGISLSQAELYQATQKVSSSASTDEGKPVLNGILIRSKGDKTILVATDSYRLATYELEENYQVGETIVPSRAFGEAIKIAGELGEEIINLNSSTENNQLLVRGQNFQISTRLIDGVYPNFEQIIPTEFVTEIEVSKNDLSVAVKQAAVFARETGNVVKVLANSKGNLRISASTKQVGEGGSRVAASVSGDDLEVAINSKFLLDGLESVNADKILLKLSGSLRPARITAADNSKFTYIVMPVKPQN